MSDWKVNDDAPLYALFIVIGAVALIAALIAVAL